MVVKKLNSWIAFLKSKHLKVFFGHLPASKRAELKAEYRSHHKVGGARVAHRKHVVRRTRKVPRKTTKRVIRRVRLLKPAMLKKLRARLMKRAVVHHRKAGRPKIHRHVISVRM